jgi:Pentapeptide repeats (9 copies)
LRRTNFVSDRRVSLLQRICVVLLVLWCVLGCSIEPALAVLAPTDRPVLTLELLQERLKNPLPAEGTRVLDLSRFTIDLRPENAEFRDQFYTKLQAQLQRPGPPLGLDLSYARIQGDLILSKLGLRTPLYGQSLTPVFSEAEQAQLQRDRRRLFQLQQLSQSLLVAPNNSAQPTLPIQITVFRGPVKLIQTRLDGQMNAANTFFLNRVEAEGTVFMQDADWTETRFSQSIDLTGAEFRQEARFRNSIFFSKAGFSQSQYRGAATFQGSEFQNAARFNQSLFRQSANFSRTRWQDNADFSQTRWQSQISFTKAKFLQSLFLTEATFEQSALFQEAIFEAPVNLRSAQILSRADFSYSRFGPNAYLNIAGLEFDADQAKILGDPGQIGQVFSAPTLSGNETLFRNLVQNFRQLQHQVEYTTQRLRLRSLTQKLWGINLNAASAHRLGQLGFSVPQITQILDVRQQKPFRTLTDLLSLNTIDLATYIKVRGQAIAENPLSPIPEALHRLNVGWQWLGLSLLLLLTRYGSSTGLVFGVGLFATTVFGVLFWVLDRWRRRYPQPIQPTFSETLWIFGSAGILLSISLSAIIRSADAPGWTLLCLGILLLPLPLLVTLRIYQQGRYHDLMTVSYFVEEGTFRQLRLLIGRLPVIPRYELFRERYLPLLWNKRWNWLNYYDFSLNNLLRLGFNDIRLRDQHLPGLISTLVWYQWSLGVVYISLLLWTLSRTIPGLNLLIYLK